MSTASNTHVLSEAHPISAGLEGVLVAETALSHVDGSRGRLILAGHDVERAAGILSFETVCALLWGEAGVVEPNVNAALGLSRERAFTFIPRLGDALSQRDAMAALRTALSHLSDDASALDLVASVAVFAAAHGRIREGKVPIAPHAQRGHAEDLLCMLGLPHDAAQGGALDAYLVTVSDHGLNASTFAARVVTSTGSDLVSAVVAGVGALKGPLHGGAPGPVLDMLDAIGRPEQAEGWLRAQLARGERIMGMGHRIYRVRDPRTCVLEQAIERLEQSLSNQASARQAGVRERLRLARATEHAAEQLLSQSHPTRPLRANVEFYTAVLLEALGIPRALFSTVFAAGRVAGWTAHVAEQRKKGKLIRPSSRYVGVLPSERASIVQSKP